MSDHWCEGMDNMDKKITYLENKVNQRDHQIDALKYKDGCINCDHLDKEIIRRGERLIESERENAKMRELLIQAEPWVKYVQIHEQADSELENMK